MKVALRVQFLCGVIFVSLFEGGVVRSTYLGRLPGMALPSGKVEVVCSLKDSNGCEGQLGLQSNPGLDAKGQPLEIVCILPMHLGVVLRRPF